MSESWDTFFYSDPGDDIVDDQRQQEHEEGVPADGNNQWGGSQQNVLFELTIDPALVPIPQNPAPWAAGSSLNLPEASAQTSSEYPGPPPDQVIINNATSNPTPRGFGQLGTVHEPLHADTPFLEQTRILSSYVNYGPQQPGEQDADYFVRLERANMNEDTDRRMLPQQAWQALPEDEQDPYMDAFLQNLANEWEEHRAKITPGSPHYDVGYHQQFQAQKAARKRGNAEKRAISLRRRRALEAANDLDPVPDPISPLSSGDELYSWSFHRPFPPGYNPRDDLNRNKTNRNNDGDGQPHDKGKGRAEEKQPDTGMGGPSHPSGSLNPPPNEPQPGDFGDYPTYGVTATSPHPGGGRIGVPITDPLPNPHLGLPAAKILPGGYFWSDARCNHCQNARINCDAFPKKTWEELQLRALKNMTKVTVSFPCKQCLRKSNLAKTCTWAINKTAGKPRTYWTGRRSIVDPVGDTFREVKGPRERYKIPFRVPYLEEQINIVPEKKPVHKRAPVPAPVPAPAPAPPWIEYEYFKRPFYKGGQRASNVSGSRISPKGKITKPNPPRYRGPSRIQRSKRRCQYCVSRGARPAFVCDISQKHPCSRCSNAHVECIEDHTVPGDGQEVSVQAGDEKPAAVLSTLVLRTRASTRASTIASTEASTARAPRKGTGKGTSGRGEISRGRGRGQRARGGKTRLALEDEPVPVLKQAGEENFEDNDVEMDLGVILGLEVDEGDNGNHGCCNACATSKTECDEKIPCFACKLRGISCDRAEGQIYQDEPSQSATGLVPRSPPAEDGDDFDDFDPNWSSEQYSELFLDPAYTSTVDNTEPPYTRTQQEGALINIRNAPVDPPNTAPDLQPFAPRRYQIQLEALLQQRRDGEQRALDLVEQTFTLSGEGSSTDANAYGYVYPFHFPTLINSDVAILDTRANSEYYQWSWDAPSGPVLPDIMVPPGRIWPDISLYDGTEDCHELEPSLSVQGIARRCHKRPTQTCSVLGHTQFCVCRPCREKQEFLLVDSSEGPKTQNVIIEDTKVYYCAECAAFSKRDVRSNAFTQTQVSICLCTGQMRKRCLCNGHRLEAMLLVQRRSMLMADHIIRKLNGRPLPCARCSEHTPSPIRDAWQCMACQDVVVDSF